MNKLGIRISRILSDQMIPCLVECSYLLVVQPLELVQLEARSTIHVFGAQRPAPGVVEQHDARPVLSAVDGLLLTQELIFWARLVVMLHNADGSARSALHGGYV